MSLRLGNLRPKEVIRKLKRADFYVDHTTGSHVVLVNPRKNIRVVVPYHARELKRGLLFGIIKQAGLTIEEFHNL
ncbi:MAG: type II toxin-antitoxin system HicA family toxin [Elusimicrobia bacterium]|nr:type II toxin-antitoxin system HicA family toxin [Elusimicrobiota bacterium]